MSYRYQNELRSQYAGRQARLLRSLLSRREARNSNGERLTALGREAADGSVEEDEMDVLAPVGIIGCPAENATVETLVGYIGADGDHPVSISFVDHTRRAVIDATGLDADETLIYTSQLRIKLCAQGTVEIATLQGEPVPLATKADVQVLWDYLEKQFDEKAGHTHATPSGPTTITTSAAGAAIGSPEGTAVLRAE